MTTPPAQAEPRVTVSRFARAWPWLAIGVVALTVRLVSLEHARETPFFAVLQGDAEAYDTWGRRIAAGDVVGRETFYQAPLYPYFLACIYAATDRSALAVRYVQATLGAVAAVLLGKAAERWFDRRVGLITAAIFALNPTAIFFDGIIQKSSLEAFLTAAFFMLLASACADGPRRLALWIATGFTLGLLALARENALIWGPVALAAAAWSSINNVPRRRIVAPLCCLFGLAIPLGITAARNHYVGGEPQVTTSQFGSNFYIGNHAGAKGLYEPLRPYRGMTRFERTDAVELAETALGRQLSAGEVSRYWANRSWTWIREEPGAWFRLLLRKARLTWYAVEIGDTEDQYAYADGSWLLRLLDALGHFGIIAPLAAVGIAATWPRRRELWVPYLLIASYAATTTLFYVFSRYRFPLTMLLMPFAAAGIAALVDITIARDRRRAGVFVAIGLITAVVVNRRIDDLTPDRFAAASYSTLAATLAERGDTEAARRIYGIALERDEEAIQRLEAELEEQSQQGAVDELR